LLKSDINFSALGEALNLTRQTVSTKFKNLIKLELITPSEDGKVYYLNVLP
jgi:DNA-binding MarR family transcriptional regulator